LEPLNWNSPFRLHESYPSVRGDLITTNVSITGTRAIDVFIWVLKAGEFLKACYTRFSNEG
jgi:hypothetical protein